jgi:hypothetical protein
MKHLVHTSYRATQRLRPLALAVLLALGAGAGLTLASPLWAQNAPAELPAALAQAIALHDAAVAGDEKAASAAREALADLVSAEPDNAVALAYLGSTHAVIARDAFNVVSKMSNTNKGLRHLDKALELAPQDVTVRMVRANVNWNLPEMFGRRGDAIEDMIVLDRLFRSAPRPRLAKAMQQIYARLNEAAAGQGDWDGGADLAAQIAAGG